MELVYLWVEKYKNIVEQGFNFSPRFKCEFKAEYNENNKLKDNCELIIKDNKDYVSIFPDNINVTAIVGENGSGKSSLLKSIKTIWENIYYIYFEDEVLYSNYLFIKKESKYEIKKNKSINLNEKIQNIIFMNRNFFMELPKNSIIYNLTLESDNLYTKFFELKRNMTTINLEIFHKKILKLILNGKNMPNSFFNPNEIEIDFKYFHKELIGKNSEKNIVDKKNITRTYRYYYNNYCNSLNVVRNTRTITNLEERKHKQVKLMRDSSNDENIIMSFDFEEELDSIIIEKEEKIDTFFKKFVSPNSEILLSSNKYTFKNLKNIEILKTNDDYEIFFYLIRIGFLEYNFLDNQKSFALLSTGEKNLFSDFVILNNKLQEDEQIKNTFIFLDEPDTTLHPQWQKKQIQELINLLSQYEKKFHLILTSHSPFILSDLPKEHVIFLEKYDEKDNEVKNGNQKVGNCKNATKDIELKTFGANIHTLLSNGFFMSDGLMGEFAKSKINEAIDNLHGKSQSLSQKQIKSIIDSIGEPFLQIKLEQMYKEKFGLDNEIEELEKRQEEINQKIEQLKKQKSENAKS